MTLVHRLRLFLLNFIGRGGSQKNANEERNEILRQQEMTKHLNEVANLEQKTWEKLVLYSNLVLILAGGTFLYVYFSISPFTPQELTEIRSKITDH